MDTISIHHQQMEVKKQASPFSSFISVTSSSSDCNVKRRFQELDYYDLELVDSQIIKPSNHDETRSPFGMKGSKKLKTEKNSQIISASKETTPTSPRSISENHHSEDQPVTVEPSTVDKSHFKEFESTNSSSLFNLQSDKSIPSTSGFHLPEKLKQKTDFSTLSKLKRWFKIMDKASVSSKCVERYLQEKAIKSEKHHVKSFTKANQYALYHLEKLLFNSKTSRKPRDLSRESSLISYIEDQVKGPKLSIKQYIDI